MAINGRIVVERPAIYRPNMTAVTALENVTYYARVSTDSNEQEESYERQKEHFEAKIKSNPKWNYVEGYADWGVTGTKAEARKNFMRMIEDCRAGKINRRYAKVYTRTPRPRHQCVLRNTANRYNDGRRRCAYNNTCGNGGAGKPNHVDKHQVVVPKAIQRWARTY